MEKTHIPYFNPNLKYLINDYVLLNYPENYTTIDAYYCKIIDIDTTDQYLCSTIKTKNLWISEDEINRKLTTEEIQTYNSLKV